MNSNKTDTETVRVETYLNRIVLFQRIVIKLKQEKIHQPFDCEKQQRTMGNYFLLSGRDWDETRF